MFSCAVFTLLIPADHRVIKIHQDKAELGSGHAKHYCDNRTMCLGQKVLIIALCPCSLCSIKTSFVFSYLEALIRCHIVVLRCHCHYQEVKNCRMPSSIGLSTCFSSSSHAIAICAYKSLYAIVLFYYKHWQFLLSLILLLPCDMRRLPIIRSLFRNFKTCSCIT